MTEAKDGQTTLIGVASFGIDLEDEVGPDYFTMVGPYRKSFLDPLLQNDEFCEV